MAMLSFVVGRLLLLAGLMVAAWLAGRRWLRALPFRGAAEAAVFSAALGLGLLSHALLLLGLLGLLRPVLLGLVPALALLLGWRDLCGAILRLRSWRHDPVQQRHLRAGLVAALALVPLWLPTLLPPSGWDALSYHLPLARAHLLAQRIAPVQTLRFPVFPQLAELLYAALLAAGGETAAQQVPFVSTVLVAAALGLWGLQARSWPVGLAAATLWLGSPLVAWLGTQAYVDSTLALFVTLGTWAFFRFRQEQDERWLRLSAALLGLAAATKYTGLFFAGLFGLWLLVDRRPGWPQRLLSFALLAAGLAAPWYVFVAWHTGNPLFPFLGERLGRGPLSAEDLRGLMDDLRRAGRGRDLLALLRLPWDLALHQGAFRAERALWPLPWLALPLLAVAAPGNLLLRRLLLVVSAYLLLWFTQAQQLRYLVPIFGLLCLATALGLAPWVARLHRLHRAPAPLLGAVLLLPGWDEALRPLRALGPPPATPEARQAYLLRREPRYAPLLELNRRHGRAYRVYALYGEDLIFWAEGTVVGDWFGPARYARIEARLHDGEALYQELRALGCDHFLLVTDRIRREPPADPAFARRFALLQATPTARLYALR
ncbi:MAG: glycosyltransferase family 39 protein [Myxococcales bacterium]|nr:glycosyltransferase family 39 protein [Myxococcales bacterium]